jgi:hypothetical protein
VCFPYSGSRNVMNHSNLFIREMRLGRSSLSGGAPRGARDGPHIIFFWGFHRGRLVKFTSTEELHQLNHDKDPVADGSDLNKTAPGSPYHALPPFLRPPRRCQIKRFFHFFKTISSKTRKYRTSHATQRNFFRKLRSQLTKKKH